MKIARNTAYLCGHFISDNWRVLASQAERQGWEQTTADSVALSINKNYYYGEFVDFLHNPDKESVSTRCHTKSVYPDHMVFFSKKVGKDATITLRDGSTTTVAVDNLQLWIAPFGIVIFSISIQMAECDYSETAEALQLMRDICHYNHDKIGDFIDMAITPVYNLIDTEAEGTAHYQRLTHNGNKLKIFQIIETDSPLPPSDDTRRMIYNIGCLMPLEEGASGDDSYYNRVMETGHISIFSDWSALALFDTFTMLSSPLPDFRRKIWIDDYFGMIYIYMLYRQSFLYHYNSLFRAKGCDIKQLEADILLFERRYCFDRFSYNFLPTEIGRAIDRSLELKESTDFLHSMVTQAGAVYEKESDDKMNRVLTLLAIITICSTIWDLFSLLNAAFAFKDEMTGFRIGTYLLILTFLIIYLVMHSRRKKR